MLQALVEANCLAPLALADRPKEAAEALQRFWVSGAPLIGEEV
jgi:hypothetical protein